MKFKAGDTFDYSGEASLKDGAGDPVDLTGWTLASKVRFPDAGREVGLTAEWLGGAFTHVRVYAAATATADWPPGPADIDIQFTSPGGAVVSTETVRFYVLEDLT
jgi:hypothetical protein